MIQEINIKPLPEQVTFDLTITPHNLFVTGFYTTMGVVAGIAVCFIIAIVSYKITHALHLI